MRCAASRSTVFAFGASSALIFGLTACGDASKSEPPPFGSGPPRAGQSTARATLAAPLARVSSRNARGSARMLVGRLDLDAAPLAMAAEAAARLHLERHARLLGLSKSAISDAVLSDAHSIPGGGGVFRFTQRVDGVEVFGGRASVVLDGSRRLVSLANSLAPSDGKAGIGDPRVFATSAQTALARAYELFAGTPLDVSAVQDTGSRGEDVRSYGVSSADGATRILEATAKRVLYPDLGRLSPAYYVELLGRDPGSRVDRAVGYAIDAKDGDLLYQASLTQNDAFSYRVWADPSGNHIPTDGPFVDYSPNPAGMVTNARPEFAASSLITMEGFNKNPNGNADPWLSPTDTVTFGNNVRAYSDRNDVVNDAGAHSNNGYNSGVDIRADVTGPKTFDRTYDVSKAPNASTDQIKAAVTQIFYTTNWLHDYWYDSGFDEKSGVAQLSNYGRGGKEGDPLLAEAQDEADSGEANNANMSTLGDGTSPRMQMYVWSGSPMRDGTIDNTVVAHEWGHYLHHRLVLCGSPQCDGMSEGWGDFNALMMVIKDGDQFSAGQVYPLAQYATSGLGGATSASNYTYFGIRRAPYSTDLSKDPFTFKHVRKAATLPSGAPLAQAGKDMSEPHNVGEIWASALFDAYVNLLAVGKAANRSFEETKRRMADYVVAGMKATPTEPTFVEQRDALLAAVLATGRVDDFSALAQGFAKRGLGAAAVAPPLASRSLNEMVENFDSKGDLSLVDATVDDSVHSCDHDGYLDASEAGKLNLRVRNGGWLTLTKTQVRVSSSDPRVTFDGGGVASLPSVAPYQQLPLSIGISASNGALGRGTIPITITLSDPDAANPTSNQTFTTVFNLDDKPGVATIEDVESEHPSFVPTSASMALQTASWSREGDGATGHFWHGDDVGTTSDESLVSPTLAVSATSAFTIAFSHRYEFESGPPAPNRADVYFDGGVLELSDDDGATWKDISTYANPSYTRTIFVDNDQAQPNVLAGRKAFGGQSANYPMMAQVSLDLGMKLAGKMVQVRFRIGTDEGTGAAGWDVDDVAFGGITNTPFASLVENATPTCAVVVPPTAGGGGGGGLLEVGGAGSGGQATGGAAAGGVDGTIPGGLGGATAGGVGGANAGGGGVTEPESPSAVAATPSDSGCSCSTVARAPVGRYRNGLALLGLLALVARRRRTRAPTSALAAGRC
jgi:MYXO-CTERM domain-containing protein